MNKLYAILNFLIFIICLTAIYFIGHLVFLNSDTFGHSLISIFVLGGIIYIIAKRSENRYYSIYAGKDFVEIELKNNDAKCIAPFFEKNI